MNSNNLTGRSIALMIGAWFVIKTIVNIFIGGGLDFVSLLFGILALVLGFLGIKYTNYAIAAIAALIVLVHLFGNIKGLFNLDSMVRSLIYLAEGAVDIICAAVLCIVPSVKEHFTNGFSGDGY